MSGSRSGPTMWSNAKASSSYAESHDSESEDNSEELQTDEQISWQLGGLNDSFVPSSSSTAAAPSTSTSRETRPKRSLQMAGNKRSETKSPPNPKKQAAIAKARDVRKKKTRRKVRLTMPKIRPPAAAAVKPVKTESPPRKVDTSGPLGVKERDSRLQSLFASAPSDLVEGLRAGSVTVGNLLKNAEQFRHMVEQKIDSGTPITELIKRLEEERDEKMRLEAESEYSATEDICRKVAEINLTKEETDMEQESTFNDGPSDARINAIRALLGLPPLKKEEESDPKRSPLLMKMGFPEVFIQRPDMFQSLPSSVGRNRTPDNSSYSSGTAASSGTSETSHDITDRTHPRETFQQLGALLGKNFQQKMEKRAAQRARRNAFMENVTEERVEQTFFNYIKRCLSNQPSAAGEIIRPEYHYFDYDDEASKDRMDSLLEEWESVFVKLCGCRDREDDCEDCKSIPPLDRAMFPSSCNVSVPPSSSVKIYEFCFACGQPYPLESESAQYIHPKHAVIKPGESFGTQPFGDIHLHLDYVTEAEERDMIRAIGMRNWSHRDGLRRQDYSPVVRYPRRKTNLQHYTGLPQFAAGLSKKLKKFRLGISASNIDSPFVMAGLNIVELTKDTEFGLSPNVEDSWMWGERVAVLSLCSDIVLTFAPLKWNELDGYKLVRVLVPRRSMLIMAGDARTRWSYSILSADVADRQLILVTKELNTRLTSGKFAAAGKRILEIAEGFKGKPVSQSTGV